MPANDSVDDAQQVQKYLPKPSTYTPLETLLFRRIDFLQQALYAMIMVKANRVPNAYDGSSQVSCEVCNALKKCADHALSGESWEDDLRRYS